MSPVASARSWVCAPKGLQPMKPLHILLDSIYFYWRCESRKANGDMILEIGLERWEGIGKNGGKEGETFVGMLQRGQLMLTAVREYFCDQWKKLWGERCGLKFRFSTAWFPKGMVSCLWGSWRPLHSSWASIPIFSGAWALGCSQYSVAQC